MPTAEAPSTATFTSGGDIEDYHAAAHSGGGGMNGSGG